MEVFCEILKDMIDEKEISLRKLSIESGVSATQYSKYLKGAYPTISVAVKIANYFNCSLSYLFGLIDNDDVKFTSSYDISKFLQRYENILKENNITHWKFCRENGFSESSIRHWKYGQVPKVETLILISQYFGVSIDYLVGRSENK